MNDKPIHPHELLAHNAKLKKHIINKLFTSVFALVAVPLLMYMFYNPPVLLTRFLFGIETTELTKLEQRNKTLEQEANRQKQRIDNQNKLIAQLQKRNKPVSSVPNSEQLRLPVVSSRFISWQAYLKQHPNAKFSDFRDAKEMHLESQIDICIRFFHQLRENR